MFNRGGTSAYGRGITSNLVSDEQRQRFNDGGRVRAAHGLPHYRPYTDIYSEIRSAPPGMGGAGTDPNFPPTSGGLSRYYPERKGEQYVTSYIPQSEEEWKEYQMIKDKGIPGYKTVEEITEEVERFVPGKKSPSQLFTENKADHRARKAWESSDVFKKQMRKDLLTERQEVMEAIDPSVVEERKSVGLYTPGVTADQPLHQEFETRVVEEEKVDDTSDELDFYSDKETEVGNYPIAEPIIEKKLEPEKVNPFAFLDEYEAEKKKQGRGQALWEGAAAAIDWSTAGTAKERSKAISTGLRKVGTIGAKYKGEAMDLRAKAKILGAVEDIKGEHKLEEWDKKLKEYYGKSVGIQEEELELKKEIARVTAERLAKGEDPKSIYASYTLPKPGDIITGQKKKDLIKRFTNRTLTVEDTKNSKDLRDPVKNKGLVFIDINGNIVRNDGTGTIKDVDEYTDEYFTWIKP